MRRRRGVRGGSDAAQIGGRFAVTDQHKNLVREAFEKRGNRSPVRSRLREIIGEKGEKRALVAVAKDQRITDEAVARSRKAKRQRVGFVGEIGTEDGREGAAQPEALDRNDFAPGDRATREHNRRRACSRLSPPIEPAP